MLMVSLRCALSVFLKLLVPPSADPMQFVPHNACASHRSPHFLYHTVSTRAYASLWSIFDAPRSLLTR